MAGVGWRGQLLVASGLAVRAILPSRPQFVWQLGEGRAVALVAREWGAPDQPPRLPYGLNEVVRSGTSILEAIGFLLGGGR